MTLKMRFQIFHIQFLNSDFSIDNESNVAKLIGHALCIPLEGSVSQIFELGLSYFFLLCRKFVKVFFHYFCMFHIIQIEPGPKSKF